MKYLLVLAVVWVAIFIWRQRRRDGAREEREAARGPAAPKGIPAPQAMVRCAHCGVHLPASDALPGPGGAVYCSAAHRQAAKA